ncbi:hypothetical protein BGZ47_011000 [Haplosporangium gracile]|nr:hypothetical protein BGZ47_011000 [Haplosporangium gracile]
MAGPPIYASLTDTGDIPPPRMGHCMIEAKNGTKIVVFGGFDEDGVELGDVYVLDVATLEWTAGGRGGLNGNTTTTIARGYAACGMSNNLFVAWGGARRDPQSPGSLIPVSENITVVYNLTSQMWQSTFSFKVGDDEDVNVPTIFTTTDLIPTVTEATSPHPSPTFVPPPAMGAIVGGSVVGGLTLIATAGMGLFFYRRRKLQPNQRWWKQEAEEEEEKED